jgi:hypothetical protein
VGDTERRQSYEGGQTPNCLFDEGDHGMGGKDENLVQSTYSTTHLSGVETDVKRGETQKSGLRPLFYGIVRDENIARMVVVVGKGKGRGRLRRVRKGIEHCNYALVVDWILSCVEVVHSSSSMRSASLGGEVMSVLWSVRCILAL